MSQDDFQWESSAHRTRNVAAMDEIKGDIWPTKFFIDISELKVDIVQWVSGGDGSSVDC